MIVASAMKEIDCNYIYYFISFPVSSLSGHTQIHGGLEFQMILKTVCSWLALILDQLSSYGDGEFGWSNG